MDRFVLRAARRPRNTLNKYLRVFVPMLALSCLALPGFAQKVWDKKPYQQWSQHETERLFRDSPWVRLTRNDPNNPESHLVLLKLQSSILVRQGLVRQSQFLLKYDQLTTAEKTKFDSQAKDLLECPDCQKYYILAFRIIDGEKDRKVTQALRSFPFNELKTHIFLTNDSGDRRNLSYYIPPYSERVFVGPNALFYFNRFDEQGKSLLTIGNKELYFQIGKGLKGVPMTKVAFRVSRLIRNGEIMF